MIKLIIFILKNLSKFTISLIKFFSRNSNFRFIAKITRFIIEDPILSKLFTLPKLIFKSFILVNTIICSALVVIFKDVNIDILKDYYLISNILSMLPLETLSKPWNWLKSFIKDSAVTIAEKIDEQPSTGEQLPNQSSSSSQKVVSSSSDEELKLSRKDYKNTPIDYINEWKWDLLLATAVGLTCVVIYWKWDSINPAIISAYAYLFGNNDGNNGPGPGTAPAGVHGEDDEAEGSDDGTIIPVVDNNDRMAHYKNKFENLSIASGSGSSTSADTIATKVASSITDDVNISKEQAQWDEMKQKNRP